MNIGSHVYRGCKCTGTHWIEFLFLFRGQAEKFSPGSTVISLRGRLKKKIWPKVRHVSLRGGGQKFRRAGVSLDFG